MKKTISSLVLTSLLVLISQFTLAGSATWKLNPTTSNWNSANNWTPATIPNGPSDTATFATSNSVAVSIPSTTEVEGIVFSPGARSFSITCTRGDEVTSNLTLSG